MRKIKKYKWRDKSMTSKNIFDTYMSENPNSGLTLPTFRARLKMTKDDVESAFNYSRQPSNVALIHDCPDGVRRTHSAIAEYFKVSYSTWNTRFNRNHGDIISTWNEQVRSGKGTRQPRKSATIKMTEEMKRQQEALNKLPSASAYEIALHG